MSAPLPDALGTSPTWIRTKVFTAAPQKPVNSFQTPTHKENNSDLSALVIFRPLLANMVGDIGRILPVLMRAMLIFTNQMNDEFILISLAFFQSGWKRDAENAKKAITCASEADIYQASILQHTPLPQLSHNSDIHPHHCAPYEYYMNSTL